MKRNGAKADRDMHNAMAASIYELILEVAADHQHTSLPYNSVHFISADPADSPIGFGVFLIFKYFVWPGRPCF